MCLGVKYGNVAARFVTRFVLFKESAAERLEPSRER